MSKKRRFAYSPPEFRVRGPLGGQARSERRNRPARPTVRRAAITQSSSNR